MKLHIDGLGAPMKARVRSGGTRKLQVGSNLEFLKVGRGLEIEDVEQGERRGARIDAVSIAIDPQTQVPQLVVALRYDGEDTTPEPSVIGHEEDGSPRAVPVQASAAAAPVSVDDVDALDAEDDEDDEPALRGKVDAFAVSVGNAAKNTGEKLAAASGSAASGFAKWAKIGGAQARGNGRAEEASPSGVRRQKRPRIPALPLSGFARKTSVATIRRKTPVRRPVSTQVDRGRHGRSRARGSHRGLRGQRPFRPVERSNCAPRRPQLPRRRPGPDAGRARARGDECRPGAGRRDRRGIAERDAPERRGAPVSVPA